MSGDAAIDALVDVLSAVRPEWPAAGIRSHVERAAEGRAFADVALASVRVAHDRACRLPAVIELGGPHWRGCPSYRPQRPAGIDPDARPAHAHAHRPDPEVAGYCVCRRPAAHPIHRDGDPEVEP